MANFGEWFRSETFHHLVTRKAGALFFVIGGAAVLEWAQVFGDGGEIFQLLAGLGGVGLGAALLAFALKR